MDYLVMLTWWGEGTRGVIRLVEDARWVEGYEPPA